MSTLDVEKLDLEIKLLSSREIISNLIETPPIDFKILDNPSFWVSVMSNAAMLALPDKNGVIDRNAYIMGNSPAYIDWSKRARY